MRHLTIIAFTISISACAAAPKTNPEYDKLLDSWMGQPVEKLVSTWGVPQGEWKAPSGSTVLTYEKSGARFVPGVTSVTGNVAFGGGNAVVPTSCRTTLTASPSGVLNDWSYEGNGC